MNPLQTSFDRTADAAARPRLVIVPGLHASGSAHWQSWLEGQVAGALRWRSDWINLGNAGHINVDSGYGPFPLACEWAVAALNRLRAIDGRRQRVAA